MFGFRYHVVTLCALFIMLGIGIVIGSTSGIGPALSKQQTLTIQSLNSKLNDVLAESEQDHALLRQHEEALTELVPQLVAGKLAGKRVAIIRTGDYSDAADAASDAITTAGGTVSSVTTLTNRLQLLDQDQLESIASDLHMSGSRDSSNQLASLMHPIAAILHVGVSTRPDLQSELTVLHNDGVIDTSGDYSDPVTDVVLVGGSISDNSGQTGPSGDQTVELALIAELTAYASGPTSMVVVGAEPYAVDISSMPTYAQAGIASVDCIDLPIGALDLPYALIGGDSTAYGVKTTATRLVPVSLGGAAAGAESNPSAREPVKQ